MTANKEKEGSQVNVFDVQMLKIVICKVFECVFVVSFAFIRQVAYQPIFKQVVTKSV